MCAEAERDAAQVQRAYLMGLPKTGPTNPTRPSSNSWDRFGLERIGTSGEYLDTYIAWDARPALTDCS